MSENINEKCSISNIVRTYVHTYVRWLDDRPIEIKETLNVAMSSIAADVDTKFYFNR